MYLKEGIFGDSVWITVIPQLTKIIRSGVTFFSYEIFFSRNTYTDRKDKLLEWPDRS